MHTPVVLLTGRGCTGRVAAALRETPGTAVISHTLDGHVVRRRVSMLRAGAPWDSDWILELGNADPGRTIHDDLLILLRRVHRRQDVDRVVVLLDERTELELICYAINHTPVCVGPGYADGPAALDVHISSVVTCVDTDSWLAHAMGDDELDDHRSAAQAVVDQAEFADVLVLSKPERRTEAVLRRLAPRSRITCDITSIESILRNLHPLARRGADFDPHESLLTGQPPLVSEAGVSLLDFTATRPFHPARLHTAIDVLLEGVVRTRGRVWLASQPDTVVWIESAGMELRVGNVGRWLAAMDASEMAAADADRRIMAAARCDDQHGDRHVAMTILTCGADPGEILRILRWALLTDEEFSQPGRWANYADPFGDWRAGPFESVSYGSAGEHPDIIRGHGADDRIGDTS